MIDKVDTEYKEIFTKPPAKALLYNHYDVSLPNMLHQIDILYLPHDGENK